MKQGSATAHANHDESLVVRLYGGDVDPQERSRALDLLAACEECAALFADLGSIASATAALPVAARPRDFTLTEADAARLRPRGSAHGRGIWAGLTRQLGGAFAAIGLAGVMIAGALTAFAPAASVAPATYRSDQIGAAGGPTASGAGPEVVDASAGAVEPSPKAYGASSPATASGGPSASMSGASNLAASSPVPPQNTSGQGEGTKTASDGQPSGGGPDLRLAILLGSAGLLLLGLLLLVGPRLRARRIRG